MHDGLAWVGHDGGGELMTVSWWTTAAPMDKTAATFFKEIRTDNSQEGD